MRPFRDQLYCFVDTPHAATDARNQINAGAMDGFVVAASGTHESPVTGELELLDGKRAMGYYTRDDIPFTYWLAQNFAIGDHYFSSVPTSTWTNRQYLFAATSFGQMNNDFPQNVDKTFFDYLNRRQIDWKFYYAQVPTLAIIFEKFPEYQQQGRIVPSRRRTQFQDTHAAKCRTQRALLSQRHVSDLDVRHRLLRPRRRPRPRARGAESGSGSEAAETDSGAALQPAEFPAACPQRRPRSGQRKPRHFLLKHLLVLGVRVR